jgi:hypothetical protein
MAIDVKKLEKGSVYEAQAPLESVLADVAEIDKAEQQFAQARKAKVRLGFLSLGIGVLGIVLAVFAVAFALVGVLMALAGFACAVILWVSAYRYGRNLKTYRWRFELLGRLAASLQQDSDPKAPVKVSLGLKDRARFLKEEVWPVRPRGKQRFTADDWLSIQGRFLDGAEFSETVQELIRTRTYTNPRGKSKTKCRSRHFIGLRLACPKDSYGDLRPLEEGLKKNLRLPASATLRGVKVGEKAVFLKVRVAEAAELSQANVMLFLGLYRALNLARQMQGRQK